MFQTISSESEEEIWDDDEIDSDDSDLGYISLALGFDSANNIFLGKRSCKSLDSKPKRLHFYYNSSSRSTREIIPIPYIGKIQPSMNNTTENFDISRILPRFFPSSKE